MNDRASWDRSTVVLVLAISVFCLRLAARPQGTSDPVRAVALTFDDLPSMREGLADMEETTRKLLQTLTAERIPAIGFVKEMKVVARGRVDERTALLEAWLDAGFELGNHTYSHVARTVHRSRCTRQI